MGLLLVVVHRSMISLKYATMSRSEYRRLQSTPSGEVLDEFQKQIHLFSGWDISNSAVIEFEVAAAAARTGVVLPHLKLYLPACNKSVLNAQVSRWHRFLKICGRNVQREPDTGAYYVCVRDVCTALPAWAYHHMTKLMKFGTFFAAFNALLLATIPFMRTAGFKDMDPWAVIYFCTSTPVTFCFGFVILNFLNLALLSVFRQLDIAYSLNEMISLSDIYLTANLRFADASHVSFANKYSTLNGDAVYDNGKLRYFDDELDAKHVGRILGQDITGGNGVDDTRKAEVDDVIVGSNRYEDCRSAKPQNIVPKEIKPEDRCPSSALYRSQPEFDPNTSNSVELMQLLYKKHQALGVEGHEMGTDYEDISDFDWLRDTMGGVDDTILESPTNADENLEEVEFFPADKTFSLHAFDKVIEVEDSSIKDSESDKMHRKLKINPSPRKRAKYKWKEKDDFESATSVANSIAHEIESVIPRVSVQYASNIYSWLYTRNVMHNYGTRFRFRVDCFIGVITLILFFLMMLVTVEIVLTTQDERYNVLMGTVVLQCLLSVVITTFYSIVFISAGAYVNDYYQDHRYYLAWCLYVCCACC